jgi:hypothetical protein
MPEVTVRRLIALAVVTVVLLVTVVSGAAGARELTLTTLERCWASPPVTFGTCPGLSEILIAAKPLQPG